VIATVLFAVAFGVFAVTSTRFLELRDEGHILELSRGMVDGQIPHRDSTDVYGPGLYAVTAAALLVGDDQIMAVRYVLAAARAGTVVVAFLLARNIVPIPFAVTAAVVSLIYCGRISWNLNVPYGNVYSIPICMVSCLALVEALRRDSARLYFVTGLVAGFAILFKQTLGIMNVFVLALAMWAAAASRNTRRDVAGGMLVLTTIGLAGLAAGVSVLPFLQYLHWQDYVVHFAPIHVLIAMVAIAALRRGEAPDLRRLCVRGGLPFGTGALVFPALVAGMYAYWGALDKLLYDMFVLPAWYQNYYVAVSPPPRALSYTVVAVGAACSAGMLVAGRRHLAAAVACGVSGIALLAAWLKLGPAGFATWSPDFWAGALDTFGGVQLFALSAAALVAAAPQILARRNDDAARNTTAVLVATILFVQSFAFMIFPSASFNVFLIQGGITPLLGYALWSWYRTALGTTFSRPRRMVGFALALVVPVWMTHKVLMTTVSALSGSTDRIPVHLHVTDGIALEPDLHRALHITEFEQLVDYLQRSTTPETRLLLMTNEEMILFASQRRHALPDYQFLLFLTGWGLMHGAEAAPKGTASIVDQLDRDTDAILVIDRSDKSSANVRRDFPELAEYVDTRFELEQTIGGYRVLKRKAPAAAIS
jgi:hypothetical protein